MDKTAGFEPLAYQTGARVKGLVQAVASKVPGGGMLTSLMSDEHEFQSSGVRARAERNAGADVSNWFNSQFFINKDGLAIFWRSWVPEGAEPPRAIVVVSHGMGEHSGRYELLGARLAKEGMAVYALDHQGHGQSEGTRLFVKWFHDYVVDVHKLTEMARLRHPNTTKTFLLGHSMGALIAIHAANEGKHLYNGVVLGSPPLKVDKPPFADKVVPIVAGLLPKLPAPGLDLATLCRDESVIDRYLNDPLVCHGMPRLRLMNELMAAIDAVPSFAPSFPLPYLLQHGLEDRICLPEGSLTFHALTDVEDKTLVTYDKGFHELFNEPDREEAALGRAVQWLLERL